MTARVPWLYRAPDPGTDGPCTRCARPTARYGVAGSPLCDRCQPTTPAERNPA